MAKDSLGTIIGLGAAGFAAYWLYNNVLNAPAGPITSASHETTNPVTSTTPASTPAVPAVPDWMANLDALRQKLETMGGGAANNIDQWVFQYNQLRQQRNMQQLTGSQIAAILAVNPATVANRAAPIPASEFVNDIFGLGYGLSGLRGMGAVRRQPAFWPIMRVPFSTRRIA
jgi:hypothetical protein